jgi:hypothetical protein
MATIDFDAIGAGIAARFAPAAVTPPAGLGNVRRATADLPNQLTILPVVLVMPDRGALAPGNGSRLVEADYLVRFHFSLTKDLPRETNACRKWLGILIDQVRVGEVVGVGPPIAVVRVTSYRVGILPYAGRDYTGVELGVRATLSHAWAA